MSGSRRILAVLLVGILGGISLELEVAASEISSDVIPILLQWVKGQELGKPGSVA